jgi:tetratricopeptide (TPR) repeat protein
MSNGGLMLAPRKLSAKEQAAREELIKAGDTAFDADDFERALECYHRASALDGSDPEIWSYLGLTYANLDFPHEAWRSYKLALTLDPEHTDSLWYAAEFLANMEDYLLAKMMLERYLLLEADAHQLSLARELLTSVLQRLPESASALPVARKAKVSEEPGEEPFDDVDDEELDPELDEDDDSDFSDVADEDSFEIDGLDEDDGTYSEMDDETFVGSLNLQLNGLEATCGNCGTAIPLDAPYCYNCHAIHFYRG